MSRSHKKTPIFANVRSSGRYGKTTSHKKFRTQQRNAMAAENYDALPYKQRDCCNPYDITDGKHYWIPPISDVRGCEVWAKCMRK